MSFKVLFLRGTAAQNAAYTGVDGELTLDITNRALRIHDGVTAGGHAILGSAQIDALVQGLSDRIDSGESDVSDINTTITAIQAALEDKLDVAEKGVANGVATLDNNGKLPLSQINDAVLGQVEYMGVWDATTNTPTLPTTPEKKGDYYVTSVAGEFDGKFYEVGDWIISNGTSWDKVDNTDAVASVNGKTGVVVLTKADVGLGNVDNTADMDKPLSTAQQAYVDTAISGVNTNLSDQGDSIDNLYTALGDIGNTEYESVEAGLNALDAALGGRGTFVGSFNDTEASAFFAVEANRIPGNYFLATANGNITIGETVNYDFLEGDIVLAVNGVGSSIELITVNSFRAELATELQATDADNNEVLMTPLRTRNFIESIGFVQDGVSGEWSLDQGTMS